MMSAGLRFVLAAGAWTVGLFALLRLPVVQSYLLLPFATAQGGVASRVGGVPAGVVVLDPSCSAADVMALCLGVIFAFPAPWRERFRGAGFGLLLIAGMNTVRIGHLSLVAGNPALLALLHVYVWPALLAGGVLVYVFFWMRRTTRTAAGGRVGGGDRRIDGSCPPRISPPQGRFLLAAIVLLAGYFVLAPWLFASRAVAAAEAWVAATAGILMGAFGATVTVSANILQTARGPFVVTPECILTPLIPVYAAAVLVAPLSRRRKLLALAAGAPIFFALGTARLLVLAVPASLLSSPLAAVHAFSQVVAGVLLVAGTAWWATRIRPAGDLRVVDSATRSAAALAARLAAALAAGLGASIAAAVVWDGALIAAVATAQRVMGHAGHDFGDPQGALALLPAYQLGLLVALWVAFGRTASWPRFATGLAALAASQVALVAGLGELFHHGGLDPHISLIRAWAVAAPLIAVTLIEQPDVLSRSYSDVSSSALMVRRIGPGQPADRSLSR